MIERLPKASLIDAKIAMYDMYEYHFGIFNHADAKDRPLASVAFHEAENYTERTVYYDALLEFAEGGFYEIWGLNVQEFLNLPTYVTKMMKEVTREVLQRKSKVVDEVRANMENASKGKK